MKVLNIIFFLNLTFLNLLANSQFFYNNGQKIQLKPMVSSYSLKAKSSVQSSVQYYKTNDGIKLGVSDEILVKLHKNNSIDKILIKYDIKLIKRYSDNIYLLRVNDSSRTLEIANSLHLENNIKFAHPNFIKEAIGR